MEDKITENHKKEDEAKAIKRREAKAKLIKKEKAALKKIVGDLPTDKKKLSERLIEQCAFQYATLNELCAIINQDGALEWFINGKQEMWREHPAVKSYNTTSRTYMQTVRALSDISANDIMPNDPVAEFNKTNKKEINK